jgi:hypothetical protein
MSDLYAIWSGFGSETKAALIGAVSTCLVGTAGFGSLILQIKSQGKQSREAVAENERRRLKTAMYEDGVLNCRQLADTAIELSTKLRMMMMQLEVTARAASANLAFDLPSARLPAIAELYAHFSDAVLSFIFLVENRRIVDPRILVFRTAMNAILYDTREIMFSKFVIHLMPVLPVEGPDGGVFSYTAPSVEAADVVKALSEAFINSLDDAVAYTDDFLVELQNHLLGDLFNAKVIHRIPLDPDKKVISFKDAEQLGKWFETSTEWGKANARVLAETAVRFKLRPIN